jgi:plastocyanin
VVTKTIILLLIVLSIIISGCLNSEDRKDQEQVSGGSSGGTQKQEVRTPEKTGIKEERGTPAEMETQAELGMPKDMATLRMREESGVGQTKTGIEEEKVGTVQPTGTAPASHLVRLKNDVLVPSRLRVNTGDTVVWRNYQASSAFILTGSKHLFEDERLAYGNILEYTFKESGSYTFSVKGYPKMEMTITVK